LQHRWLQLAALRRLAPRSPLDFTLRTHNDLGICRLLGWAHRQRADLLPRRQPRGPRHVRDPRCRHHDLCPPRHSRPHGRTGNHAWAVIPGGRAHCLRSSTRSLAASGSASSPGSVVAPSSSIVWTSLGPLPRWVPGPTTRWAPGTTRLALHGT
jgi:hypothetical protein